MVRTRYSIAYEPMAAFGACRSLPRVPANVPWPNR